MDLSAVYSREDNSVVSLKRDRRRVSLSSHYFNRANSILPEFILSFRQQRLRLEIGRVLLL